MKIKIIQILINTKITINDYLIIIFLIPNYLYLSKFVHLNRLL